MMREKTTRFALPKNFSSYVAITPALVLVLGLMVYPVGSALYHSFTVWDGVSSSFIGLQNYWNLLIDPQTGRVLLNSLLFLLSVPLIILCSLVSATLIYEQVAGYKWFRVLFFLPAVLSTAVIGMLFKAFFAYEGPVNQLMSLFGINAIDWLSNGWTAMMVIVIALVWSSFGYGLLIFLAAMGNIDPSVYEAAKMDGASWLKQFTRITLPLLTGAIQFFSVINVIYVFTSLFGFIFVMTSGGPGFDTTTIDYYIYLKAFSGFDFGSGSALAFLLFIIVFFFTWVQMKMFNTEKVDGS